ncbi:MAG TPA: hemolysin family protein [Bacteroidota bacterium]|nr:hemolysin family protein [Bacteroidota bacterium]
MDTFWIEILGVLFLIAIVGFFSACEVAVLSSRKSRMRALADEGERRALLVLLLQEDPERFLATVHIGIVFSLILASGLGALLGSQHLVPSLSEFSITWVRDSSGWLSLGIIVVSLGFLVVVFGELLPKSLALRSAEKVALRVAPAMQVFEKAFRYPAMILTAASNLLLVPFAVRQTPVESGISEEEFKLILEEGTRRGVIDKTEQELIGSIFEFTDTTAKEVMIPRPDVVALRVDMSRERIIKTVLEEGYSRMPVYRGTIDNIIGVVYTKDLLGLMEYRDLIILQDVIRPAYFVPETKKISQLMRELQQRKIHIAIVIDEFGGTSGIITMEDILEEIVGEIHDEYDEDLKDVEQAADGAFLVNARMPVREFNERFGAGIPPADDYETVGGLLQKLTGRIPEVGEEITHENLSFTVVKKSQRRIRQVRLRKKDPDLAPPTSTGTPT